MDAVAPWLTPCSDSRAFPRPAHFLAGSLNLRRIDSAPGMASIWARCGLRRRQGLVQRDKSPAARFARPGLTAGTQGSSRRAFRTIASNGLHGNAQRPSGRLPRGVRIGVILPLFPRSSSDPAPPRFVRVFPGLAGRMRRRCAWGPRPAQRAGTCRSHRNLRPRVRPSCTIRRFSSQRSSCHA